MILFEGSDAKLDQIITSPGISVLIIAVLIHVPIWGSIYRRAPYVASCSWDAIPPD